MTLFFSKDFPGRWGEVTRMDLSDVPVPVATASTVINEAFDPSTTTESSKSLGNRIRRLIHNKKETDNSHKLLGEWHATAIAGNDISSSCLYTAGLCAQKGIISS